MAAGQPISIDEVVQLYIDRLCVRCDKDHKAGECTIGKTSWHNSDRRLALQNCNWFQIIAHVRRDRARKVMGK